MNEIRMYVESLFQGRVLTPETIELKEEIYGNLMARFEDYQASGLSTEEALEKTKASITSIDDMLEGEPAAGESEAPASAAAEPSGKHGASAPDAATTAHVPRPPVGPTADEGAAGKAGRPRKPWMPFAIAAVVLVVILGVCGVIYEFAIDPALDSIEDTQDDRGDVRIDEDGLSVQSGSTSVNLGKDGLSVKNGDDELVIGPDGSIRFDGELVDDLLKAVVNDEYTTVDPYAPISLSEEESVRALVAALPMGEYATVDLAKGAGVLGISYEAVPERFDGDSVECALVYDTAAIMCAISEVDQVEVSVSESDEPYDLDHYVFTREMMEGQFGCALTSDMVSDDGWTTIKNDHLYKHDFADHTCERAEDAWDKR